MQVLMNVAHRERMLLDVYLPMKSDLDEHPEERKKFPLDDVYLPMNSDLDEHPEERNKFPLESYSCFIEFC